MTYYFTKWVEAILVKGSTSKIICDFLKQNIISWFGVPNKIVIENAVVFSSKEVKEFYFNCGISLAHASNYYPQANGQVESNNKNIVTIMRKLIESNQRTWHKALFVLETID